MVYYDDSNGNCYPFTYKGVGGNMNRFNNEKECIRNCSSQAEALYPQDERKACFLPLNKGSDVCRQQTVRFRYDPIHDKCKFFLWKGCIGNGNRFLTKQQCNDTCDGVHVDGDELDEDEVDTPIGK
ncbi:hypothetical protein CRUP_018628 [Coryphaenoides rupestris]|nr:hypothetical protein CRUP_018628 [Coryphaenoides rupestris]